MCATVTIAHIGLPKRYVETYVQHYGDAALIFASHDGSDQRSNVAESPAMLLDAWHRAFSTAVAWTECSPDICALSNLADIGNGSGVYL